MYENKETLSPTTVLRQFEIKSFSPAILTCDVMTFGYFSCCKMVVPDFLPHNDVTAGCDAECQYVCKLLLIRQCLKLALNLYKLLSNITLENNVTSSQNMTKFICFCWYTNMSNYNYMLRPFLVAIIRLYIPSFKSYVQYVNKTMFDDEVSNILIYNVIYNI